MAKRTRFALGLMALVAASNAAAADLPAQSEPTAPRQYGALPVEESEALIATVIAAQNKLREGETLHFRLLSGAPASYPTTLMSPREAFLGADFSRPFSIEPRPSSTPLWRPYRVILTPDGPGELLWEVEVVLGGQDRLEQVQMLQRPPHPF